ncbi:MAG: PspC domain-containing protein [Actinomycetota bacterium]|nr:PspC domain-containing protein [Actinomycetota bacterium]
MAETVRDFWATRPRRRVDERKCAGVAAALGRRYRIDPVLVRVGFVVATVFSGAGVLLYLLGWLLLPVEGDEASAAESVLGMGRSSVSTLLTVILGLALIPVSGAVFDGYPRGLIMLVLCNVALFMLHRHRSGLGEVPSTAPVASVPIGTEAATSTDVPRTTTPPDMPRTTTPQTCRGPPRPPGIRSVPPRSRGTCPSRAPHRHPRRHHRHDRVPR